MSFIKKSLVLSALGALVSAGSPSSSSPYMVKERHVVPRSWKAVGPADKSAIVNLQIGLKQSNEGVIEEHLLQISNPKHDRYGKYLSAEEVAEIVRPKQNSIDLVHSWLEENGVVDIGYAPAKDWISVILPIEKVEELLQTTYTKYEHADGQTINRAPEWSLPSHLHAHIDVIQPTTSFFNPKANMAPVHYDLSEPDMTWWNNHNKPQGGPGLAKISEAVLNDVVSLSH
jgi:tripeptidyl-peptidase-1